MAVDREGVVAKDLDAPYRPGQRTGMIKVKLIRTIDAVVAGYRPGKEEGTVGSLILGLYDDAGQLHIIGHSSGLKAAEKRALVDRLAPTRAERAGTATQPMEEREGVGVGGPASGARRRGQFDHESGGRIRHGDEDPPVAGRTRRRGSGC